MSKGRYPKRVMVDANNVTLKTKRNQQVYKYSDKTPAEINADIKVLFAKFLGIFSEEDFKGQSEEITNQFEQFSQITELNEWKKIKNKKMRENLINDYVIKVMEERQLSIKQAQNFAQIIDNAIFNIRTHGPDDITMEEGQIIEIEDILIDEQGFAYNPRWEDKKENLESKRGIKDRWAGYLKGLVDDIK